MVTSEDLYDGVDVNGLTFVGWNVKKNNSYFDVKIDSDLEQAIIEGMPEDVTELEKAIYIYIKMCKLLTYDDEYYAVNQTGIATVKRRNIDFVSSITLKNNKVVCFIKEMVS